MNPLYQQLAPISPLQLSAITVPPPATSSVAPCHLSPKISGYLRSPSESIKHPMQPLFIPPPAISAIISSNKQSVIDRKLRRKAETHKTIPCRAWKDTGRCNYGTRCKFAHGEEDLRKVPEEPAKVFNNPRYRTELCVKYHYLGSCPYGERCSYIHEPTPQIDLEKCLEELSPPSSPPKKDISSDEESNLPVNSHNDDATKRTETSNGCSKCTSAFRDPFISDDEKENIELKLLPFMESFLKRPFHVR